MTTRTPDSTLISSAPNIVLVRPQMQENIGATARAMANFALSDLRLVSPREKIAEKAYAMSSGATDILDNAQHFDTTQAAIAQTHFVLATTARSRDLHKPVYSLSDAMKILLAKQKAGLDCSILFGPERTGLENNASELMQSDDVLSESALKVTKKENITYLLDHLIGALDEKSFFYPIEKRTSLVSVINNIFTRNQLNDQEVGVLHGIIKALLK